MKPAKCTKNARFSCGAGRFRWIWLIQAGFAEFVIQITVLAGILGQYPAREGREKMVEVLCLRSIWPNYFGKLPNSAGKLISTW
jgi:hypothetical protein